jgi:hypothetical protein
LPFFFVNRVRTRPKMMMRRRRRKKRRRAAAAEGTR